MNATLCEVCRENPVIVDELWGHLETCEECNDGTPHEPWEVTTPGQAWEA